MANFLYSQIKKYLGEYILNTFYQLQDPEVPSFLLPAL